MPLYNMHIHPLYGHKRFASLLFRLNLATSLLSLVGHTPSSLSLGTDFLAGTVGKIALVPILDAPFASPHNSLLETLEVLRLVDVRCMPRPADQ
jgi:hypothetical protein